MKTWHDYYLEEKAKERVVCQPIYVKEIDEDNVGYESDVYFEVYGDS